MQFIVGFKSPSLYLIREDVVLFLCYCCLKSGLPVHHMDVFMQLDGCYSPLLPPLMSHNRTPARGRRPPGPPAGLPESSAIMWTNEELRPVRASLFSFCPLSVLERFYFSRSVSTYYNTSFNKSDQSEIIHGVTVQ